MTYEDGKAYIPNKELMDKFNEFNLCYLAARDRYQVVREDKAGKGYVDFIFYPERKGETCIILELKVDRAPEEAIRQIKEKQSSVSVTNCPAWMRVGKCNRNTAFF